MQLDDPKAGVNALVDLIPLASVDKLAVSVLAANMEAVLGINADILPEQPKPDYAYLPGRDQYTTDKIIKNLADIPQGAPFKVAVTELDICTPIVTFVFGESQLGGKAAIISLHRLTDDDPDLTYLRAAKIGLDEFGHLLGLGHCRAPACLMQFAVNLEKLDSLPLRLCDACEYETGRRLKQLTRESP